MSKSFTAKARFDAGVTLTARSTGRHRAAAHHDPRWRKVTEVVTVVATVGALVIQPLFPSPLASKERPPAPAREQPEPIRFRALKPDGASPADQDCVDQTLDASNAAPLVAKATRAVVAFVEAYVSRSCGSLFLRLRHIAEAPWHGLVRFVVRRGGPPVEELLPNLYEPLLAPGIRLPAGVCVRVVASITRTSFEETEDAVVECVRLAR